MKNYRICQRDGDGRIARVQIIEFADDLAALDEGEKLCGQVALEIWDDSRFVARLKAANAALAPDDAQSL